MGRILIRRGGETIAAGTSAPRVARRWLITYSYRSRLGNQRLELNDKLLWHGEKAEKAEKCYRTYKLQTQQSRDWDEAV